MKYLLLTTFTAAMLLGCSNNKQSATDATTTASQAVVLEDAQVASEAVVQEQVLNFTGPHDLTLELKSSDNFATATMTDNADRTFELKQAVAASGMKLANEDGVSIHFKKGEGVVELVPGTPIEIKEFKAEQLQ